MGSELTTYNFLVGAAGAKKINRMAPQAPKKRKNGAPQAPKCVGIVGVRR